MAVDFEGGCACGSVRYRLLGSPMIVHCCHCTVCQRETGTAFALNALYEGDRVMVLSGGPVAIQLPSESGAGQTVWRCPECRIAMWSNYGGAGDKINFVRIGTLDSPARLPPDIHIYTRSKLPWVVLPAGVRAVEAYYRRSEVWSAEAQQRREAVMAS